MAPARPAHEGHVQPALERAQPRPPQAASCHLTPPALAAPPAAFVTAPLRGSQTQERGSSHEHNAAPRRKDRSSPLDDETHHWYLQI